MHAQQPATATSCILHHCIRHQACGISDLAYPHMPLIRHTRAQRSAAAHLQRHDGGTRALGAHFAHGQDLLADRRCCLLHLPRAAAQGPAALRDEQLQGHIAMQAQHQGTGAQHACQAGSLAPGKQRPGLAHHACRAPGYVDVSGDVGLMCSAVPLMTLLATLWRHHAAGQQGAGIQPAGCASSASGQGVPMHCASSHRLTRPAMMVKSLPHMK